MSLFWTLIAKVTPLYFSVIMGFIAGKWLNVEGRNIAAIMLYLIVPLVVFDGTARLDIDAELLLLPLLTFVISVSLCFLFLWIGRRVWPDSRANVLAMIAGDGNTGYFGTPVALMLFDERTFGIYIMLFIGVTLYENSVAFYVTAKGELSAGDAVKKVLRLPLIYAFILGVIASLFDYQTPGVAQDFVHNLQGAYTILGMMIIGLGLSHVSRFSLDLTFAGLAFFAKFLLWPALAFIIIILDQQLLHIYSHAVYQALILLSIVPMAANTVVIATLLNAHPEKVATTVLASTLFALVYLPVMAALFLQ